MTSSRNGVRAVARTVGEDGRELALLERMIAQALGAELRRLRGEKGWTRQELAERLPSGIGERTVLSYEHGMRNLLVLRLIELCRVLGEAPGVVLENALLRAELLLVDMTLYVDLNALLENSLPAYEAINPWARRRLQDGDTIAELSPSSVRDMAYMAGYDHEQLAHYLNRFFVD